MRVFVYFNLTKKVWSVKALEGPHKGRVIAHCPAVVLAKVTPKISEAGRQRVIREKKEYVHAGLVGDLCTVDKSTVFMYDQYKPYTKFGNVYVTKDFDNEIGYNPFKADHFYSKREEGLVFERATAVTMFGNGSVKCRGSKFGKLYEKNQMTLDF